MFKKLLIFTLSALLCCGAAMAADTTSIIDKARQAETQSLPSTIKHLDLVLVLDKSGSMYGLESDTIGGYNAMIAKEKDLDVDTKVTTVLFNNKVDILTDRSNINSLSDMTTKDYRVGGSTALLDAVGNTIAKISDTPGISDKDHKVIFVIITDGQENANKSYFKPANLAGSMALSNCSAVTHPVFRADSFKVSPSLAACLAMVQALS